MRIEEELILDISDLLKFAIENKDWASVEDAFATLQEEVIGNDEFEYDDEPLDDESFDDEEAEEDEFDEED